MCRTAGWEGLEIDSRDRRRADAALQLLDGAERAARAARFVQADGTQRRAEQGAEQGVQALCSSPRATRASRDAGKDEIDAGEELLAVVVFAQLRPGFVHGWVFSGVELRPPCGDGCEES